MGWMSSVLLIHVTPIHVTRIDPTRTHAKSWPIAASSQVPDGWAVRTEPARAANLTAGARRDRWGSSRGPETKLRPAGPTPRGSRNASAYHSPSAGGAQPETGVSTAQVDGIG